MKLQKCTINFELNLVYMQLGSKAHILTQAVLFVFGCYSILSIELV